MHGIACSSLRFGHGFPELSSINSGVFGNHSFAGLKLGRMRVADSGIGSLSYDISLGGYGTGTGTELINAVQPCSMVNAGSLYNTTNDFWYTSIPVKRNA